MAESAPPPLQTLRAQIDGVDRELLVLLNRRAALAQQVGAIKKHEGSVAFRPEREAQVIDGLKAANPGPLKTESVAPIWREIMSACRALETPTRVAYLGPAGTFSEEAALGYFGYDGNLDSCIMLRTSLLKDGLIHIQAGAGIVADSIPASEYQETINKASALFKAVAIAEQFT